MENPQANQLPEVDSLPDGFVDSSTESLASPTPTFKQEKPVGNDEDENASEMDRSKEPVEELGASEVQTSQDKGEKTQKLRTFPVPLSESDSFDDTVESVKEFETIITEQTAGGSIVVPASAGSMTVTAILASKCGEAKELVVGRCESSDRPAEGGSDAQTTNPEKISASESSETLKNKKTDTTETKRKNPKRTFKSEKEFIEFTLKYHQVLQERDGAISVRDKLESLCRELQRQNKMLMDECRRVSTEGQNLRLELSTKFQDAIKDVSSKLDEQKDECISQLKENES